MTTQLQIRKLDRAFDQLDVNAHGQIGRDDLIGLGARMILGFGQPPTSVKGKEVLEGYEKFWETLTTQANTGPDEPLSPADFREAMITAYIEGNEFDASFLPIAEAMARLADTDNDGKVGPAEFRTLQIAFGTSDADSEAAFSALDSSHEGKISVNELVEATREFYTSPDPQARGNLLFGPL